MVVMDSGLAATRRPGMTGGGANTPCRDPRRSPARHPPRTARSAARRISRSRRDRCRPHCARQHHLGVIPERAQRFGLEHVEQGGAQRPTSNLCLSLGVGVTQSQSQGLVDGDIQSSALPGHTPSAAACCGSRVERGIGRAKAKLIVSRQTRSPSCKRATAMSVVGLAIRPAQCVIDAMVAAKRQSPRQ
ncbi:hypothetical protein ES707_16751 [subsurface metagenome]